MKQDETTILDTVLAFTGFGSFILLMLYSGGFLNYSRKKVIASTTHHKGNEDFTVTLSHRYTRHVFRKRRNVYSITITGGGNLPYAFLDSHFNEKFLYAVDRRTFYHSQRVSLEGDFDKFFHLYVPAGMHIDVLSILSPDLMMLLKDALKKFDMEFSGSSVIIRTAETIDENSILGIVDKLLDKITRFNKNIGLDDKVRFANNPLRANTVDEAVKIGRRLVSTRVFLTVLIFLYPLVVLLPILILVEMSVTEKLKLFMSFLAIGGIGNLIVEYYYRKK